ETPEEVRILCGALPGAHDINGCSKAIPRSDGFVHCRVFTLKADIRQVLPRELAKCTAEQNKLRRPPR
ncbi:MAG TPA: hypothetical protein VFQ31_02910, partial [Methyloceanibacter sp.]|nr:hypothetical protein [Methyloceanibacter sp.]